MYLSLTTILIGITALSSIIAFNRPALLDRWMFIPYRIKQRNQWDRFILSGFIHKDYMHLLFNMFTFYFFGGVVERFFKFQFGLELGGLIFIGFYLAAVVVADIPTYLKEQRNSYYKALGASGGTSATVFASIILMPLSDICLFGMERQVSCFGVTESHGCTGLQKEHCHGFANDIRCPDNYCSRPSNRVIGTFYQRHTTIGSTGFKKWLTSH